MCQESLQKYFTNIKNELENVNPQNIWNYDKTNLSIESTKKRVIMKCDTKYPEKVVNHAKSAYSVMFCGNAVSEVVPPCTAFKLVYLHDQRVVSGPKVDTKQDV